MILLCDEGVDRPIVERQNRLSSGVLLLRLSGLESGEKQTPVAAALRLHGEKLMGAFSVITSGKLRIRRRI